MPTPILVLVNWIIDIKKNFNFGGKNLDICYASKILMGGMEKGSKKLCNAGK